jgi:hypothetical protein
MRVPAWERTYQEDHIERLLIQNHDPAIRERDLEQYTCLIDVCHVPPQLSIPVSKEVITDALVLLYHSEHVHHDGSNDQAALQ